MNLFHEPYEIRPFRPGKSFCPDCDSETHLLAPEDLDKFDKLPAFFLCKECNFVGQVGVKKIRGRGTPEDEKKG